MDYEVLNFFFHVWSFVGALSVVAGLSFMGWVFDRAIREILSCLRKKRFDKYNKK